MASKRKTTKTSAPVAAGGETTPAAANRAVVSDSPTSLDVSALREIVGILENSDVSRLFWKKGEERLLIRRQPHGPPTVTHAVAYPMAHHPVAPAPVHHPAPLPSAAPIHHAESPTAVSAAPAVAAAKPGQVVTSPFVGTFYTAPSPDAPAFAEVGQTVRKGQVLCIIEAMKLMNEIESEIAGKVAEVLAENGQAVEFGQPLFRIEPA